jgi:cytochrome c peroxidase
VSELNGSTRINFILLSVDAIYKRYSLQYPDLNLPQEYLDLFHEMSLFVQQKVHQNYKNVNPLIGVAQPKDTVSSFDHFTWIQKYVNPLYKMNQNMISKNHLVSLSYIDYSMNSKNSSIFDKSLYHSKAHRHFFKTKRYSDS